MSWTQQVWHVFRKDVWDQRWLLGLYAVLVTIGVLEGTGTLPSEQQFGNSYAVPKGIVLRCVAAFLSASVVLEDSPTGPRAFWATLPFERGAVFAAKSMLLALVLFGHAAALVLPLLHLDVSGTQLSLTLLNSALSYATILVATALFASVVSHLRTVLVLYVGAGLVLWLGFVLLRTPFALGEVAVPSWLLTAMLVLAMAALAMVYRARRTNRTRQAIALVGCACLLIAPLVVAGIHPALPHIAADRISGWTATLDLALPDSTNPTFIEYRSFAVELNSDVRVDGIPPTERVELITTVASIVTADGSEERLPIQLTHRLAEPKLPVAPNARWVNGSATSSRDPAPGIQQQSSKGTSVKAAHLQGISRLHAEGRLEFREPRLLATVPAALDTLFSVRGWRFALRYGTGAGRPIIGLTTLASTIGGNGEARESMGLRHLSFMLVNEQRGEALRLFKHGFTASSAWSLAPAAASRTDGILSPSPYQGELNASSRGTEVLDLEWLRGAKLVVYEWVLTRTSPVSLSTELPQSVATAK